MDRFLDQPIADSEADLLGFGQVAESLVTAIRAQPNGHSLTLGLDGPWGSGKSSILKLLQQSVENNADDEGIGTVVVSFSPWLITNRTALVSAFFAQISAAIQQAEKRIPRDWGLVKKQTAKTLENAKKRLNSFSKIVSVASTATTAFDPTMISAVAAGSTKALQKLTDDSGKTGKTLEALKTELMAALGKIAQADSTFKILVLIDDLDRLDPGDVIEVLRLVKAVGDFPATIYLLAYDRSAVAKAIQHGEKIENGDSYLEKIIQFSFKVPPLEPFQLRNWLRSEIEDIFPDQANFHSERARAVLGTWAGRLLSTPRDIKRLLFALRAVWPSLEGRADLLDLVWLQMLAQKASAGERDLYSWVVEYLQGLEAIAIGGMVIGKHAQADKLSVILKALGFGEYDHDRDKASFDFHHLDDILAGVIQTYLSADDKDWIYKVSEDDLYAHRKDKRLSSPWHWRLYFALNPPFYALTDNEWNALTESAEASTEKLSETLGKLFELRAGRRRDAADQIIGQASYLLARGALTHPARWLLAFAQHAGAMKEHSKPDAFAGLSKVFEMNLTMFARQVFKAISGAERAEALNLFKSNEFLSPASLFLRDQYHASKKEGYKREERFSITDEELQEVIPVQVALFQEMTPADLRNCGGPYDVLYCWRDITDDASGPEALLNRAFENNSEFLETLESLRYLSSSSQHGVPHLPESFLKHFVDTKSLKARLEKMATGNDAYAEQAKGLLALWWSDREAAE